MSSLTGSLAALQQRLEAAGIQSAVIGAIALGVWGDARATRDTDLKILLTREEAGRLLDLLGSDYTPMYPDPLGDFRGNGIAFFRDKHGVRIDMMLADTGFDENAIRRGVNAKTENGDELTVATAEDLIIYKLISTRERDHADLHSIFKRQAGALDHQYVRKWLRDFEEALADSTFVAEYERLRAKYEK